jgi:hypothetical protein
MSKLSDDRDAVHRENDHLRKQIDDLLISRSTKPVPPIVGATAMLKPSTVLVPLGPSMLIPADGPRARDHRPNWALDDEDM